MAEGVGTVPESSRITKRQLHRTNPEASSVEEYYRRVLSFHLLIILSSHWKIAFLQAL